MYEVGYRTRCRKEPLARIAAGPERWGKVIVWDDGTNPPEWWYDPFQRLDPHEHFYSLVQPDSLKENDLLSAAERRDVLSFAKESEWFSSAVRIFASEGVTLPDPYPETNLLTHRRPAPGVQRAILALLQPSQRTSRAVERFVRDWGIPESPLPREYEALSGALSKPAYPVLRILYLAHEMHYVIDLLVALQQSDTRATVRAAELLSLLRWNTPSYPALEVSKDSFAHDPRITTIHRHPLTLAKQGGPAFLRSRAACLIADVLWIRLQHVRPSVSASVSSSRQGRPLYSPTWACLDLLSAMWTVVHTRVTGLDGRVTPEHCPGCGLPFLRDRRNRRFPRGHEETCGKRVQRAKKKTEKPSGRGQHRENAQEGEEQD